MVSAPSTRFLIIRAAKPRSRTECPTRPVGGRIVFFSTEVSVQRLLQSVPPEGIGIAIVGVLLVERAEPFIESVVVWKASSSGFPSPSFAEDAGRESVVLVVTVLPLPARGNRNPDQVIGAAGDPWTAMLLLCGAFIFVCPQHQRSKTHGRQPW